MLNVEHEICHTCMKWNKSSFPLLILGFKIVIVCKVEKKMKTMKMGKIFFVESTTSNNCEM